jgi:glutathione S-transferase
MMRLHVLPPSPRAIKVLAVKNHLGLECEIHALDYFKADQTRPEFAALNPNKRMPVIEEDDWVLWESNAILFYLACKRPDAGLWPSGVRQQADVMRWLAWESSHWDPAWDILLTERVKKSFFISRESGRRTAGRTDAPQPPDAARIAEGERYVRELAAILDSHLSGRNWLVAERSTIADFALAAWMPAAASVGLPLTNYDAVARWYDRVAALPGWREAVGAIRRGAATAPV